MADGRRDQFVALCVLEYLSHDRFQLGDGCPAHGRVLLAVRFRSQRLEPGLYFQWPDIGRCHGSPPRQDPSVEEQFGGGDCFFSFHPNAPLLLQLVLPKVIGQLAEGRSSAKNYDLSLNRYKEVVYEEVQHDPPQKILAELKTLEIEILQGIRGTGGDAAVKKSWTLKDACEFVLDGTHALPERIENGIPVLSAQNVNGGTLSYQTERFTSESEYEEFKRRLAIKRGDLLLTIPGTIGRAAIVTEVRPVVFQRSVAVIRPRPEVLDSRFLYHISQSADFTEQLRRSTDRSSQAGVYLGKLCEISLDLPPMEEQRRIAAILEKADALRQKRRRALQKLDSLTQSIFLDMFGDPALNPRRFPLRRLGELALKFSDGPFGSNLKTEHNQHFGVRVVRLQDIGVDDFINQDRAYISETHARSLATDGKSHYLSGQISTAFVTPIEPVDRPRTAGSPKVL